MNIVRWQPFTELMSLRQAMDKLFEESFVIPSRFLGTFAPGIAIPVDMYQTANDVVVKAALPGVKPEEIDISVTGDTLTIPKSEQVKPKQIKVKAKGAIEGKK